MIKLIINVFVIVAFQSTGLHLNLDRGVAIQGYDPVSYFLETGPQKGKKEFAQSYGGATFYFANSENKKKFEADPKKYEPAYGGWCAYAMGDSGEKVKIDPETYKIIDGRLYLFYNFFFNNTLTDWNKDEMELKKRADENWQKIIDRKNR